MIYMNLKINNINKKKVKYPK